MCKRWYEYQQTFCKYSPQCGKGPMDYNVRPCTFGYDDFFDLCKRVVSIGSWRKPLTLTLPGPSAGVSAYLDSYCSLKPLCSGMGGSSAGSYLADPTSPIPSHCAVIILFQSVAVHQLPWLALQCVPVLLSICCFNVLSWSLCSPLLQGNEWEADDIWCHCANKPLSTRQYHASHF